MPQDKLPQPFRDHLHIILLELFYVSSRELAQSTRRVRSAPIRFANNAAVARDPHTFLVLGVLSSLVVTLSREAFSARR